MSAARAKSGAGGDAGAGGGTAAGAAAARRGGGKTARVVAKLQASVDRGDYYATLQLCQTLANRKRAARKLAEAIELVKQGTLQLLRAKQAAEASVLSTLLLDLMIEARTPVESDSLGVISSIAKAYPAGKHLVAFLSAAVSWSCKVGQYQRGDPRVHHIAAKQCRASGDYAAAAKFYVQCEHPQDFAAMMCDWARLGYAGEVDLFLARGVLKLLCLKNLRDANAFYDAFLAAAKRTGGAPDTPLVNFLKYLLLCLERDAAQLFKALANAYQPSIKRDPEFTLFLAQIGKAFYNIQPPKTGLSAMLGMMEAMMGGGKGGVRKK